MKSLIDKNNQSCFTHQKLDTDKLLTEYINHFGLGYVIRHYEIAPEFINQIANGKFSDICDEDFTASEIRAFQKTLVSFISKQNTSH